MQANLKIIGIRRIYILDMDGARQRKLKLISYLHLLKAGYDLL